MDEAFKEVARKAYERGRMRLGMLWSAGLLVCGGALTMVSSHMPLAFGITLSLAAFVLWFVFKGQALGAAVQVGLVAGSFPVAFTFAARSLGTFCTSGTYCMSWCMLGCSMGAIVSAIVVSALSGHWRNSVHYWAAASGMTILTGSFACSCAGMTAFVALIVSFGLAMVPALLWRFAFK